MASPIATFSKGFTRTDALLLVAALAGLLCYVFLLPTQHPDAAADYHPGPDVAVRKAESFLAAKGYSVDGLSVTTQFQRSSSLLDSLQRDLGRATVRSLLQEGAAEQLPVFYWQVVYRAPKEQKEGELALGDGNERYRVALTPKGRIWRFSNGDAASAEVERGRLPNVDREALRRAFDPDNTGVEGDTTGWEAMPDTLLAFQLRFRVGDGSLAALPQPSVPIGQPGDRRAPGPPLLLDEAAAVAIARYHLQETMLNTGELVVDSVWVLPGRARRVAHVRFVGLAPVHGRPVRADVEVLAVGSLRNMEMTFNGVTSGEDSTVKDISDAMKGGAYALLILILLVVFFRRIAARLIDVKAALLDAAVFGMLFGAFIGLSRDFVLDDEELSLWVRVLIGLAGMSMGAGLMGLFVFLMSSVTDSLARSVWARKLLTSSLVRQGSFRNAFVGASILRGVALGGVLLGIGALLLALFPGAGLDLGNKFLPAITLQPVIWTSFLKAGLSYLLVMVVLLGVGTFFYRLKQKAWMMIVAVIGVMTLLNGEVYGLTAGGYAWGASAVVGGVIGFAFWRYDLLTCYLGLFLSQLVWALSEGWLVAGSPVWLDVLLASLFIATLVVLGVFGVLSGKTRTDIAEYVPAYIVEMAGQERVKRELEIAHQVQASFLPRTMPRVAGLDLAGMCLPAQEVGGDYYDFIELAPGRLALVVGDVSGKGIQAAFYMTLTKGFLRTLCRTVASPAEVLRQLNTLFCENTPRGTFISMIYGIVDVEARTFTFARAGHNPVILKRSPSQLSELIQPSGLGIGLVSGPIFDDNIEEATISLRTGDVLVFYTDGFSEAMNSARELYGDERLAEKTSHVGERSASGILRSLTEDVHHFIEAAGRHDDMTMVVAKLDNRSNHAPPTAHAEVSALLTPRPPRS